MGTLHSNEYAIADAKEWVDYLDRIVVECRRLANEGRMPDSAALEDFLGASQLVQRQVRQDIAAAAGRGEKTTRTAITMTNEEYNRLMSMRESVLNLLEILEMRKAVILDRTDGVGRAVTAIAGGTFTP